MINTFSFRKSCGLWGNVEKYGTATEATDENITWRTRVACWITKTTNTPGIFLLFYGNSGYANAPGCYICTYNACLVMMVCQ
jgi:hypothetical protein